MADICVTAQSDEAETEEGTETGGEAEDPNRLAENGFLDKILATMSYTCGKRKKRRYTYRPG